MGKKIKLKHSDEYRGKIIKENERFQDKIKEKKATRSLETDTSFKASTDLEKKRRNYKKAVVSDEELPKEKHTSNKDNNKLESEVYDPLSKDLDNDGIIDRYDNNFQNSDYFESTYDVDRSEIKDRQSSKKSYQKRKNYSDKLITKTRENKGAANSREEAKSSQSPGKKALANRKRQNDIRDQSTVDRVKVGSFVGAIKGTEAIRDYLAYGSDENAGVESGEKVADASSKLAHKMKNYADKRRSKKSHHLSNQDYKIRKKRSKLEFKDSVKDIQKAEDYKNLNVYKKFQKRKQMKSAIYKQNQTRVRDRVKKALVDTLKGAKDVVLRKGKAALFLLLGFLLLGLLAMGFGGGAMSGVINSTNSLLTTSYLSEKSVLTDVNQYFSTLEQGLEEKLSSLEKNYPGFDEYIVHKNGDIGHNVHELLSYITSRYGEVKNVSEVSAVLNEMFEEMYQLDFKEEIEIRYRTVTETYTDEDGNEYTESHEEAYEYKKLIVTLHKKEMDSIIRAAFKNYPDNLTHYQALFLAQGNMGEAFGNTDLILANGGIGGGKEYEASGEVQKKIVNAAYITPSPGAGWCAMWVSQVYQNAGLGYIGGNANDMYRNFTFTSDKSKLKVGMLVAVESSSSGGELGSIYGHVGIYIGDGKVMDNIGRVRVTTLDDWIATFCKHSPVGYGFPPSVQ